jgi:hypothetical protein
MTSKIMNEISGKIEPKDEVIGCPFCDAGNVNVTFVPSCFSWNVSRIAAGSKRSKFIHDPQTIVHNKCPNCGKSKSEIKEALERGGKAPSHEEQLKRLKESGLPTKIEFRIT